MRGHTGKASGLRATRQRAVVVRVLKAAGGFRSAQEIHDQIRHEDGGVGLTTVYRTLQALADSGKADVLLNSNGEAIYRLCGTKGHHHHIVCRSCGASVEIASDELETWAAQMARHHHFTAVTHTAELYGLCSTCSQD